MAEALGPEIVTEIRSILTEHEKTITRPFVTQEQATASFQKAETAFQEFCAKCEADRKEDRAALERLIKERTARPPGALLGSPEAGMDGRSLGQKFVESAEYKAWATADQRSRNRLSVTVKARTRPELKANTITEPGSGFPILPIRVGVFTPPFMPLVMRDLFTVVPISVSSVEYVLETWNYAADYQLLEGDKKAQGDVTYTEKTAPVRTIAWYIKASRQMLADAPYFAATIDMQLLYGLAKKEDFEILFGSGAAGHLHGIMPQATPLPANVIAGILYSADQIGAAVAYLRNLNFPPTAIVMNALDWASVQIAKTAYGVYILGGPPVQNVTPTLWGLPVVTSQQMTAGTFLVGQFPPNAAIFGRETASVDIAYENEDDFIRNLVTIRCEERLALAVFRPQAFVTGAVVPTVGVGTAAIPPVKK